MIILSHTIPSRELADLPIPIVTIEREDQFVSSINTDNYMGGYQAASLLAKHDCDILLHINSPTDPKIPSYGRIQGFLDCCREQNLRHEMIFREFGHSYETVQPLLQKIIEELEQKYHGQKKGIFVSNDTHANTFLNLLFRTYGACRTTISWSALTILLFPEKPWSRSAQSDSRSTNWPMRRSVFWWNR